MSKENTKSLLAGLSTIVMIWAPVSGQTNSVLAHWSQIVGNSRSSKDVLPLKLMARFVVSGSGQSCGDFTLVPESEDGQPTPSTAAMTRSVSQPDSAFDITVCQFEMFADWQSATLYQKGRKGALATFPGPYQVGRQNDDEIVAIGLGDTGCRSSDCDSDQGVNTRFMQVVQDILGQPDTPDFVLHVGDYRYYKEIDEPDSWHRWYMEFFRPGQPLLNKTPVAFIRGNHEECNGGEGYWYGTRWYQFFEPTTSAQVTSCDKGSASLHDPWAFDVAAKTKTGSARWPHRIVMVDNSPDPKNFDDFDSVIDEMSANFKSALALSKGKDSWWAMHKPLWSYPNRYASVGTERALLNALDNRNGTAKTLCENAQCNPRAIMAGHAHMYQLVDFSDHSWPIQYVLGHGGVRPLTGQDKVHVPYPFLMPGGNSTFQGYISLIYNQNGFFKWTRNDNSLGTPSGWITENCLLHQSCTVVSP